MTAERRRIELALLSEHVTGLRHGSELEWVIVPGVPLPVGWNKESTDILFFFPAGFPETCFDNFYVERGLALASGRSPGNFSAEGRSFEGKVWDMFSWHPDGGWRPKPIVQDGSNILDWWRSIQNRLHEAS